VRRLGAALVAALALPATPALAHVEIEPGRAPAGSEAKLTLEVENERAPAATRRIDVRLPAGVTSLRGRRLHGWRLVTRSGRATLTAPSGRELRGAEKKSRFGLLVGLPRRPGATLIFKVLQTYDDGQVVRWIGPPGTSEPAPRMRLTAAAAAPQPEQNDVQTQTTTTGTTPAQPAKDGGDDDGGGVPIWAGIGLMLLAAGAGTIAARARNRRRMRNWSDE
jgi:periplasmic copper chaperone A